MITLISLWSMSPCTCKMNPAVLIVSHCLYFFLLAMDNTSLARDLQLVPDLEVEGLGRLLQSGHFRMTGWQVVFQAWYAFFISSVRLEAACHINVFNRSEREIRMSYDIRSSSIHGSLNMFSNIWCALLILKKTCNFCSLIIFDVHQSYIFGCVVNWLERYLFVHEIGFESMINLSLAS